VVAHRLVDPVVVLGKDRHLAEELVQRRDALPGLEVEDLGEQPGDEDLVVGEAPHPVAFVRAGGRDRVALLGEAQRLLVALARVDVAERAGDAACAAVGVAHAHAVDVDPAVAASAVAHAQLDFVRGVRPARWSSSAARRRATSSGCRHASICSNHDAIDCVSGPAACR
jgi:hypothetical protein